MIRSLTRILFHLLWLLGGLLVVTDPFPCPAKHVQRVPLTAEEQAWLNAHQEKITLFFSIDFPPIEYISPQGLLTGLGADIINEIEHRLGIRFHQQPTYQWPQVITALKSGECAVAPTIVRSEDREGHTFFTAPYITIPVVILTNQSNSGSWTVDDLIGKRVAVVKGFVTEQYLRDLAQGRFEVITVRNVADGMRQVSFGQVDAFIENIAVAAHYITSQSLPNLRVAGEVGLSYPLSIGVSRHYPLLFSAIEKALAAIPEEELQTFRSRWIRLEPTDVLSPELRHLLILSVLFSLLLLLGLTGVTLLLKRRLNEKVNCLQAIQADLAENEKKYRELVENAATIILRVDAQMRITFINEFAQRFFGFPQEELLGRHLVGTIVPAVESSGRDLEAMLDALRNSPEEYAANENENIRKDGERVWVAWTNKPMYDQQGRLLGLLCVGLDITERKRSEAEREKLQAQLLLAQKMESVGRLVGGVAHDFNNMLSAIIGYTELALKTTQSGTKTCHLLEQVLNAAERSAKLIRQLLAFARQQNVEPQPLDLNQAITAMLKMLERLIGEDIYLSWEPCQGLWPVLIDPTQVDQILTNLCLNARDAIRGIGQVSIRTHNVTLDEVHGRHHGEHPSGEFVLLEVRDNGCGMDQETLVNIFDPFYTTKAEGKGTGLGLATIYRIVQQNKGFVEVDSKPGKGSVFKIYLPRLVDGHVFEKTAIKTVSMPRGTGAWILLVEDEPTILDMTRQMLETLGYEVLALYSPEDAVVLARMRKGPIDLLITDVIMPRMSGRQLAERLLPLRPELRCLFMSGYPADVIARQEIVDDSFSFIQKPFSMQDLAVKVHEALNRAMIPGRKADADRSASATN
ncbi:PAS domain S-box protein [Desulfobulbus propionicus]